MSEIDNVFCRGLVREIHAEVRKHFPEIKLRSAWVWSFGRGQWEFHGPYDFYWFGRASNAYDARYKGWAAWLRDKGISDEAEAA